jgi:hypothetical protein
LTGRRAGVETAEAGMVYWVICKDGTVAGGERCFGPYESEAVARRALDELKRRLLTTAVRGFEIVLDYA